MKKVICVLMLTALVVSVAGAVEKMVPRYSAPRGVEIPRVYISAIQTTKTGPFTYPEYFVGMGTLQGVNSQAQGIAMAYRNPPSSSSFGGEVSAASFGSYGPLPDNGYAGFSTDWINVPAGKKLKATVVVDAPQNVIKSGNVQAGLRIRIHKLVSQYPKVAESDYIDVTGNNQTFQLVIDNVAAAKYKARAGFETLALALGDSALIYRGKIKSIKLEVVN